MQINRTTKLEVFERIMSLVRRNSPGYEDRVFFACGADMPDNMRDRDFIVVRALGGEFDYQTMMGSGPPVAPYSGTATVEIWKNNRQDRTGTDEIAVLDSGIGILRTQNDIIAALSGSYLELESDRFGSAILAEPLMPMRDNDVNRDRDEVTGDGKGTNCRLVLAMEFGFKFHWKLR